MTRTLGILTTAMMALLLAGPAQALHCNGEIITIGSGDATFYIDDRSDEAGEINHWTYMESNGIEGLQSGNSNVQDDSCGIVDERCLVGLIDPCTHEHPDLPIL